MNFVTFKEPRTGILTFKEPAAIDSKESITTAYVTFGCRYDNPIPTRFLAPNTSTGVDSTESIPCEKSILLGN